MDKKIKTYEYNIGLYEVKYTPFILELLEEYNLDFEEEWVSKFDDYIRLSYEPISTAGFMYNVKINGKPEVINFIDYLIKRHIKNIEKLDKLIKQTKEDK